MPLSMRLHRIEVEETFTRCFNTLLSALRMPAGYLDPKRRGPWGGRQEDLLGSA